jgi:MFS family permease
MSNGSPDSQPEDHETPSNLNSKVDYTHKSEPVDSGNGNDPDPPPGLTVDQEKKVWRKIDLRLMPILALMYMVSFLDRGNIGNAGVQGLVTQLDLTGDRYNIAITMFFIPFCLFEFPANLVLKKFRPSRWLPGITIVWGIIMVFLGLVKNYPQLVAVRACLGIAGAGLLPGVSYYLTLWYPRHYLQFRVGLILCAACLAGAFSGLLAYGISFMSGTAGLLGWSWIFILEGSATVLVGVLALFVLADFPDTAKFLTPEERVFIIWRKRYDNSSVGEADKFATRHVWAAFRDWQVWLHILIYMSVSCPLFGITMFLPSIISGFGYSPAISSLLTVPPFVLATIVLFFFAYYSDKLKIRSPFILAGLTMCLIGFSINISDAPKGVKYLGTFFCVTGSYAAVPGVISWLGNNLSGHYKRGVGMALHIGIGNFGGAIASNIYRTRDHPRYIYGHAVELMFIGIGFVIVPLVAYLYRRINAQRDTIAQFEIESGEKKTYTNHEMKELGDKGPDFRYTL